MTHLNDLNGQDRDDTCARKRDRESADAIPSPQTCDARQEVTAMKIIETATPTYAPPTLVEYGPVVALTGACDGPCVDGAGAQNLID